MMKGRIIPLFPILIKDFVDLKFKYERRNQYIFGEILKLIGERLPASAAISQVASKHNMSESEVWDIWNNR